MLIARGTRVRKQLEFFAWEGWVIGEFQTRGGTQMVAVELDQEASGMARSSDIQIFCAHPSTLKIVVKEYTNGHDQQSSAAAG